MLPVAKPAMAQLRHFLDTVRRHNQHPPAGGGRVTVDLVLCPDLRAYGMGFAQLTEQHVLGVPKTDDGSGRQFDPSGQIRLDELQRFRRKAMFMLGRAARRHSAADDPIGVRVRKVEHEIAQLTGKPTKARLDQLENEVLAASDPDPAKRAVDHAEWGVHYADVGARVGRACQQVRDELAAYAPILGAIEVGNEPQSQWVVAEAGGYPGTADGRPDQLEQITKTSRAALAEMAPSSGGTVILPAAPQWDPATESDALARMAASHDRDFARRIKASQFYALVHGYIDAWLARHPEERVVPLAIHIYNSPAFDRALIDVLAELARTGFPPNRLTLELYVTELQVDVDAAAGPDNDQRQTDGLVAAGTNVELEVDRYPDALTIKSMLAWSYTRVDKRVGPKVTRHYELDHNRSMNQLFGRP